MASKLAGVAPHAGAWIETISVLRPDGHRRKSPLTQGRGLKRQAGLRNTRDCTVAPHAGAWIET